MHSLSPNWSPSSKVSSSSSNSNREDGLSVSSSPEIEELPNTTSLIDPIVLSATSIAQVQQQDRTPFQSPLMVPFQHETHQKLLSHNCYAPVPQTSNRCYVSYNLHPATSPLLSNNNNNNNTTYFAANYYQGPYFSPTKQPEEKPSSEPQATFTCTDCHKVFSRPYNLKSHMRTHTLERPYECHYYPCGWKFARPHDLKRHELQHTGQKPHGCRFCSRRFARSDALKRHWKVDTHCAQALKEETRMNGGKQVPYARKKRSNKTF